MGRMGVKLLCIDCCLCCFVVLTAKSFLAVPERKINKQIKLVVYFILFVPW